MIPVVLMNIKICSGNFIYLEHLNKIKIVSTTRLTFIIFTVPDWISLIYTDFLLDNCKERFIHWYTTLLN